jgi:hypothetical protein
LLQKLREKDALLAESEARNEALLSERDALLAEKDEQLSAALANNIFCRYRGGNVLKYNKSRGPYYKFAVYPGMRRGTLTC